MSKDLEAKPVKKSLRARLGLKEKPKKTQLEKDTEALAKVFKELQVNEFLKYLRSPWRIMWHNFIAGVFRGLGLIAGMTVVFAVLVWVLTQMVDFPLIGQHFADLKEILESFSELQTR